MVFVVASFVATSVADPDLWGHIRFGQDILATRTIATRDTFSFTSDQAWTNHEWLAEVAVAALYGIAGVPGLLLLSVGAGVFSLLVSRRWLRRRGVGEPVGAGLVLALLLNASPQLQTIRPQLFSLVLFTTLLVMLGRAERGRPRQLLWLGAVFAAWTNLHGGWIVGMGVLGTWALLAALERRLAWGWAAAGVAAAVTGSLVNPYGWGLWRFLWDTVGIGRADISEWQPVPSEPIIVGLWAAVAVVVVIAWRRRRASDLHAFVPVALLGLMTLKVIRLEPFFALAAVMLVGPMLAGLGPDRFPLSRLPSRAELMIVGVVSAVALAAYLGLAGRTAACLPISAETFAPEAESLGFAEQNHLAGRMVTWFDYGEYAIWHLSPGILVSYDGRRETVYSKKVIQAHLRFYNGKDPGYAQRLGADYVWVPSRLPVAGKLTKAGWTSIFRGSKSQIFAWRPGHYEQVGPVPGPRCFPGP